MKRVDAKVDECPHRFVEALGLVAEERKEKWMNNVVRSTGWNCRDAGMGTESV